MHSRRMTIQAYFFANVIELATCTGLMLASIYYLVVRTEIQHTAFGRTYGEPWDTLVVLGTMVMSGLVFFGTVRRKPLYRALGLIGICTLVLIIDLSYIHLRGFTLAAYAILTNMGIVIGFGVRAWGIVRTGDYPVRT